MWGMRFGRTRRCNNTEQPPRNATGPSWDQGDRMLKTRSGDGGSAASDRRRESQERTGEWVVGALWKHFFPPIGARGDPECLPQQSGENRPPSRRCGCRAPDTEVRPLKLKAAIWSPTTLSRRRPQKPPTRHRVSRVIALFQRLTGRAGPIHRVFRAK